MPQPRREFPHIFHLVLQLRLGVGPVEPQHSTVQHEGHPRSVSLHLLGAQRLEKGPDVGLHLPLGSKSTERLLIGRRENAA